MSSLFERATLYAHDRNVEVVVIVGVSATGYFAARHGCRCWLFLDEATAYGPRCGDLVYRACEALAASQALRVVTHPAQIAS